MGLSLLPVGNLILISGGLGLQQLEAGFWLSARD